MKVSYILVWADTNSLNRIDPTNYETNTKVDNVLLTHTLELIEQILEMNPHEILIMDNEGNFPKHKNPLVKVIPSYQSYDLSKERPDWLDEITIEDYYEDIHMNHAKCLAMAYNHGIIESSGDYLILQHNDTLYIDNMMNFISHVIRLESGDVLSEKLDDHYVLNDFLIILDIVHYILLL